MQTVDEQLELGRHIIATAEVIGQVLSLTAARMIAEDLEKYPFVDCAMALKVCRAEVRNRLTLAEIVARINANDGRPGRNEAWAIALQSFDERDTVVWTREISLALEVARPVLATRDKVAARMTFLDAYDRLLASARDSGAPAEWAASVGWDGSMRAIALEQAVKLQRLSTPQAVAMLQHAGHGSAECAELARRLLPKDEADALQIGGPITADGEAIAQLLIGSDSAKPVEPSAEVREKLQRLRESMAESARQRDQRRLDLAEAVRRDLEQRKRKVDELVAAHGVTADPLFQAEQAVIQMAKAAKDHGSKRV